MADAGNAKVLKAKVEIDVSAATKRIDELAAKINHLNKVFDNVGRAGNTLDDGIKKATSATDKLEKEQRQVEKTVGNVNKKVTYFKNLIGQNSRQTMTLRERFNAIGTKIRQLPSLMRNFTNSIKDSTNAAKQTEDIFDKIYKKVKGIVAAYAGIMGLKALVELSDTMTSSQNRLNDYNSLQLGNEGVVTNVDGSRSYSDKTLNATTEQMNKMFGAAQRARVGYDDLMKNVSKSMVLAGDAFGDNIDNAIYFQEIMGKAYTLGGASAAEMASSMYQMIQALGSGTLAGDELRSVREGAPLAYQAIQEYAQGIYNSTDSLKDMASQGLITSDIVVAAMMQAGDEIDSRFEMTAMTFGQAFTMMKNTAIMAFKPILQYMNDFLNSETGQKALEIINEIIVAASYAVGVIIRALTIVITFIVNNWSWIKELLIIGIIFIAGLIVGKIGMAIFAVAKATAMFALANPALLAVVALLALIIGLIVHLAKTSKSVYDFLCQLVWSIMLIVLGVLLMITVASILSGNLIVGAVTLWLLIIIALIAAFIFVFLKYTDKVVGFVFAAGATIKNIAIALVHGLIQLAYRLVNPILGVVEWILNACNGGFNSFGGAVANLIGQIIDWFLQLGKVVTKIIDAIFGTDWTAGLNALSDKVLSWGKSENAISLHLDDSDLAPFERSDVSDAYDKGATIGAGWHDKLESMQFSDILSGITGMDGLADLTQGLPDPTDPAYALEVDDPSSMLGSTIGDISDDTSKISDSMDILDTDLKYLKELGEREAINKFTTAEIKVEMKNDNYISERVDMDGVVNYLSDKLYEELGVVANGVHY